MFIPIESFINGLMCDQIGYLIFGFVAGTVAIAFSIFMNWLAGTDLY